MNNLVNKLTSKRVNEKASFQIFKFSNFNCLSLCALLFILPSCTDFLAEDPKSDFGSDSFYKDKQTVEAGLYGVYHTYRELPQYLAMLGACGTDIAKPYRATTVYGKFCTYTFTSEEESIGTAWSVLYSIIMRANLILDVTEKADFLSGNDKHKIASECKFLRAYAYYILVCLWGDVPLFTEAMEDFDYTAGRTPIHQVYAQIVEDFQYAATPGYLPNEKAKDTAARVTHYAAVTLLGKVYLAMASYKEIITKDAAIREIIPGYLLIPETIEQLYTNANTQLKDVIDHSPFTLTTTYADAFKVSAKAANTESIFEIFFGPGELGSGWSREVYGGYGDGGGIDLRLFGAYCGKRNVSPAGSFVNLYKTGDSRFSWNIQDSTITYADGIWKRAKITNTASMFMPKYRQGEWNELLTHGYGECANNYPMIRLADVLLMYAETEIKLNNGTATPAAVNEVNRLINRARYPLTAAQTPAFLNYTTATLTFDALMKERAKELCFEELRKIDLLRTGLLEQYLNASNYTGHRGNLKRYHYLYPIPAVEMRLTRNPDFKQNEGYGSGAGQ